MLKYTGIMPSKIKIHTDNIMRNKLFFLKDPMGRCNTAKLHSRPSISIGRVKICFCILDITTNSDASNYMIYT